MKKIEHFLAKTNVSPLSKEEERLINGGLIDSNITAIHKESLFSVSNYPGHIHIEQSGNDVIVNVSRDLSYGESHRRESSGKTITDHFVTLIKAIQDNKISSTYIDSRTLNSSEGPDAYTKLEIEDVHQTQADGYWTLKFKCKDISENQVKEFFEEKLDIKFNNDSISTPQSSPISKIGAISTLGSQVNNSSSSSASSTHLEEPIASFSSGIKFENGTTSAQQSSTTNKVAATFDLKLQTNGTPPSSSLSSSSSSSSTLLEQSGSSLNCWSNLSTKTKWSIGIIGAGAALGTVTLIGAFTDWFGIKSDSKM